MKNLDYALIVYPLSQDFRNHFEKSVGSTPTYLNLPELRRLPLPELIRTLRSLKANYLFLPIEDVNSRAILPILEAIAAVSDARIIEVVHPDLKRDRISRAKAGLSIMALTGASVAAQLAMLNCKRELLKLAQQPRISVSPHPVQHLLYLNANLWFGVKAGGSIGHIAGVVNALMEQNYAVDFASVGEGVMLNSGVNIHLLQPPKAFSIPSELNYYRFQRMVVEQIRRFASQRHYSFIYQRLSIANYAGVVLSREMKVPLVLEYNGSEAWVAKNWGRPLQYHDLAVLVEEVCLKHAHLIVTVSDVLRDELIERGVERDRIACYPNCIDPNVFNPGRFSQEECDRLRQRYGIAKDAIVATFIGTFGQWHGVDVLAAAIRQMIDHHADWLRERKLHFLLVGDGLKMPKVREILAGETYPSFVTLTGLVKQEEAPAYLAASDILLSPHLPNGDGSRFFGSPTKLFEYMAMGKAIVASDLEQIGQVLHNSLRVNHFPSNEPRGDETELAVLAQPGDKQALIDGIHFLVENPEWRVSLGQNARTEALSRYTWTHHVKTIIEGLNNQFK
ncbi:glycosyltransferase family 4 protein [Microcoleus sp. ZQ-A2]|nr:glycosyltransferase family 4 protein [Microcoleus sp. FACHB-1]